METIGVLIAYFAGVTSVILGTPRVCVCVCVCVCVSMEGLRLSMVGTTVLFCLIQTGKISTIFGI